MSKTILLADDEETLRFLISETLEDEGYTIVEAEDGLQARARLETGNFDLAILDYMMPELTGVEVCGWLRGSDCVNRGIPVVLLTAKTSDRDRLRADEAGVDVYMVKPFSPLALVEAVNRLAGDQLA